MDSRRLKAHGLVPPHCIHQRRGFPSCYKSSVVHRETAVRLPACLIALTLLLASVCATAAEPVARVRVAFDRNGVNAVQAEGMADVAA